MKEGAEEGKHPVCQSAPPWPYNRWFTEVPKKLADSED